MARKATEKELAQARRDGKHDVETKNPIEFGIGSGLLTGLAYKTKEEVEEYKKGAGIS